MKPLLDPLEVDNMRAVIDDELRMALRSVAATCEQMCKRLIAAKKVIDAARLVCDYDMDEYGHVLRAAIEEFDKDNPS